ncbi:MAG TPA: hypothetical protein VGG13_03675 [Candidatus Saccharimonadales bacterium]|jgi:hypothetical protein
MPEYCTITSFTVIGNKAAIADAVRKISVEEVPMIWFSAIEVNQEFADWIEATVGR